MAGFAADRDLSVAGYRAACARSGLTEVAARDGWDPGASSQVDGAAYLVAVHRR